MTTGDDDSDRASRPSRPSARRGASTPPGAQAPRRRTAARAKPKKPVGVGASDRSPTGGAARPKAKAKTKAASALADKTGARATKPRARARASHPPAPAEAAEPASASSRPAEKKPARPRTRKTTDPPAPQSTPSARPCARRPSPEVPASEGVTARSRTRRAQAGEGAVLVTGICGRLGQLLARQLHRIGPVVGVDRRPFLGKPKDIVHHELDLRRKKTRDLFRSTNVRAVVHLGVLHDPRKSDKEHHSWNVVAFQKLLEYMHQYDVPKLVVLSSANVYGPQPDNPQFLTEDAPLLGAQAFRSIRDLVELDMLAQGFFWKHPETETVILRPCHIVGRVHNAASNYLRLERPMTLLGFDPMVQVIHERDVVDAIVRALRPGVRGIFNLRGPGELPLSRILRLLGRHPRAVPGPVAHVALDRLWRYRLTSFPPPELDHIRYVCMVDDTRARNVLGYCPSRSLEETVRAVDSER